MIDNFLTEHLYLHEILIVMGEEIENLKGLEEIDERLTVFSNFEKDSLRKAFNCVYVSEQEFR